MTPYAAKEVFDGQSIALYRRARALIEDVPDDVEWRCHELARAVGQRLRLRHVDGRCGAVEHTWLLVDRFYLDVYVPGALPQVQLLDPFALLPWGTKYVPGATRTDIRQDDVERLLARWRSQDIPF